MKKILIFLLVPQFLFSQNWIDKMQNPSQNFYDVQKEFNSYWENKTIEKGKGWKQFKRWENFMEQRVFPDGVQHPELLWEEYNNLQAANNQFNMLPPNVWTQVGPSDVPLESSGRKRGIGRVNTIAFHPTDANTIYVGAPAGGFWKSVNGGQTWQTSTDFLANLGVSDIAIHPSNPDTIYIITGDRDGGDTYSYGLLKSHDGGTSWQMTGLSFNITQYYKGNRILIDPNNPNVLIVATSNGIYRSVDGGNTFINTFSISITSMEFHTSNSNIIYGGSKGSTSVYKSSDNGITWNQSGTGLPSQSDVVRACVAVSSDNPSVVYALFGGNNNGFYGVYKSSDEGQTWSQQANSPNLLGWSTTGSDSDGQAWYDLAFEVSPQDENTLFVGGVNCWKSTNGGQSWDINTHWYGGGGATYMHADEHMLKYNPLNNFIYSGNDGGLYYSSDNGNIWTDISDGLNITQFYSLGVSQTIQDKVITGSQDNGTFLKTNSNWDAVIGGDGMECIIDYTNSNTMYGALYYGDVRKSTNGGNSFSSIGPSNNGAWETPYELDKNNPQIIYIGYDELQKSLDGGNSWNEITNGETNGGKIDEIGLSKSDPDRIYITDGSDIFRTLNAGINWSQVNNNLPNKTITYVIVSPYDENTVWVTLSGYTSGQKVYKSIDGGNNWVNISGTLPNIPVNCIELDKNSALETVYIGTDLGVFTTDSTINDWNLFNNNLPNVIVNELEMQYQSNTLFAATFGRGLWSIGLDITSPPIADFSYNDSVFCNIPASVNFLNNSYYSNTYYWDFGDGNTSTSNNPTHAYTTFGTFTVKLISTGPLGTDSIIKQQIISVDPNNPCIITLPSSGFGITQTNCNGTLYDVGGPIGGYYSSSISSITIAPPGSNQITLNFTVFDIEPPSGGATTCDYDYLEIFDGPDQNSPSLGQYCNSLTGTPGVLVSSGGSITIVLYSDGGVEGAGFAVDWTCIFPQAPPVSIFELSDSVSCNSTIAFTDNSSNGPLSWEWDFGDGSFSSLQNPVHTYLNSGVFTVKLTTTNNYGSDTTIMINAVNIIDVTLQTNGNISCGSASVILTANSLSGLINWYDNSNLQNIVDTGSVFITPILNTTTSYYAQSVYNFNPIYGGPLDNTIGNGGYYNNDRHLLIDCYKPSKLLSLDIYAGTTQAITFELRDNNSQVLCDTIINVQLGLNTLMLNFDIPIMNSLELGVGGTGSDLYRNSTGAVYPYQIGNLASITGHNSPNSNGYHYFFYNIQLAQEACVSAIESVDAVINSDSSVNQSISICQGETYQIGNNIYSYPGLYYDTLLSVNNCDSIIMTYLSVNSDYYNTQQIVLCENENYQIGNSTYTTAGIYIDTISFLNSCDSIFTTYLSFSDVAVQIYAQNNSLYSSVTSGIVPYSYLWSSGETTSSISPLIPGTFWLLVTDNFNCTGDTAYFVIEDVNNIHENNIISGLNIFPNPTEGLVEVSFESIENSDFTISILNVLSEVVFEDKLIQFSGFYQKKINLYNFAKSIYIIKIETSNLTINKKLILR